MATLYLRPTVLDAVPRRYWTPDLAKAFGLQPITAEQAEKIKSDFGIDIDGNANSLTCPRCLHPYSTYEFMANMKTASR